MLRSTAGSVHVRCGACLRHQLAAPHAKDLLMPQPSTGIWLKPRQDSSWQQARGPCRRSAAAHLPALARRAAGSRAPLVALPQAVACTWGSARGVRAAREVGRTSPRRNPGPWTQLRPVMTCAVLACHCCGAAGPPRGLPLQSELRCTPTSSQCLLRRCRPLLQCLFKRDWARSGPPVAPLVSLPRKLPMQAHWRAPPLPGCIIAPTQERCKPWHSHCTA